MARAVWKGPFVEESLIKKVDKYKTDQKKIPIKTWSRKSTIIPDFVGVSFLIYNGKKFIPITISEDMVGHKLGEFAPTKSGIIVDFLDHVFTGIFFGSVLYLSTFFIKLSSTKGPFHIALAIILYPFSCFFFLQ